MLFYLLCVIILHEIFAQSSTVEEFVMLNIDWKVFDV